MLCMPLPHVSVLTGSGRTAGRDGISAFVNTENRLFSAADAASKKAWTDGWMRCMDYTVDDVHSNEAWQPRFSN